jgi:hypothetical protein
MQYVATTIPKILHTFSKMAVSSMAQETEQAKQKEQILRINFKLMGLPTEPFMIVHLMLLSL